MIHATLKLLFFIINSYSLSSPILGAPKRPQSLLCCYIYLIHIGKNDSLVARVLRDDLLVILRLHLRCRIELNIADRHV